MIPCLQTPYRPFTRRRTLSSLPEAWAWNAGYSHVASTEMPSLAEQGHSKILQSVHSMGCRQEAGSARKALRQAQKPALNLVRTWKCGPVWGQRSPGYEESIHWVQLWHFYLAASTLINLPYGRGYPSFRPDSVNKSRRTSFLRFSGTTILKSDPFGRDSPVLVNRERKWSYCIIVFIVDSG